MRFDRVWISELVECDHEFDNLIMMRSCLVNILRAGRASEAIERVSDLAGRVKGS